MSRSPTKSKLAEPVVISVETIEHDPYEEPFVEIRRRHGADDRLVASIEVVSPANKTPGNPGREKFVSKQQEILAGQVHLIEIDFYFGAVRTRPPSRTRSPWKRPGRSIITSASTDSTGPGTFSCIRSSWSKDYRGLPFRSCRATPKFRSASRAFSTGPMMRGPYRRTIDYGKDPIIPALRPEQIEWVKARLQAPP